MECNLKIETLSKNDTDNKKINLHGLLNLYFFECLFAFPKLNANSLSQNLRMEGIADSEESQAVFSDPVSFDVLAI